MIDWMSFVFGAFVGFAFVTLLGGILAMRASKSKRDVCRNMVHHIQMSSEGLFVAGDFSVEDGVSPAGGSRRCSLARWNGSTWEPML